LTRRAKQAAGFAVLPVVSNRQHFDRNAEETTPSAMCALAPEAEMMHEPDEVGQVPEAMVEHRRVGVTSQAINLTALYRLRKGAPRSITFPNNRRPTEEFAVSKNSIPLCAAVPVICIFVIWTAAGRPPYGPFNNMGFDNSWECPPNATMSSTVCIKKPTAK
jgi:hypothetical protein